jgi:hypothetical protein
MTINRKSIDPTYNHAEVGDRFTLEIRENDRKAKQITLSDPFHHTTIHVRGWRAALAVLRNRCVLTVIVGGDRDIVEDVLELDDDYKGARGSSRREEWDVS